MIDQRWLVDDRLTKPVDAAVIQLETPGVEPQLKAVPKQSSLCPQQWDNGALGPLRSTFLELYTGEELPSGYLT